MSTKGIENLVNLMQMEFKEVIKRGFNSKMWQYVPAKDGGGQMGLKI